MTARPVMLRIGAPDDAAAIARLHRAVRQATMPYLPTLHSPEEDLAYFRERVLRECTVWVAESAGEIVGYCAYRDGWVDDLYVLPEYHGRGIGSALLANAMATHSSLRLWVFQRNEAALRFYATRGFRVIRQTDGNRNEEREPDVMMEWALPLPVITRSGSDEAISVTLALERSCVCSTEIASSLRSSQ